MTVTANTQLAAAADGAATAATIWLKTGKPDIAMIGNGVLAGLVAITAPCGSVNATMSVVIGAIGGIIVVFSWWGVNLLGVGLHTYGFTSGIQQAIWVAYGALAFVMLLGGIAYVRRFTALNGDGTAAAE